MENDKEIACWICGRKTTQGACCSDCEHDEGHQNCYGRGKVREIVYDEWSGSWDNVVEIVENNGR